MAAYVTGELGAVPTPLGAGWASAREIEDYLVAMVAILDARLLEFEGRIVLNDAKVSA